MKVLNKISKILVLAVLVIAYGCVNQEFDAPAGQPLPNGETVTVQNLVDKYNAAGASFKVDTNMYLYATVTADESTGNLYKQIFVQDATGGLNLRLIEGASNIRTGDSVRIVLNGLIVSNYRGVMQLDSIKPAYDIITIKNNVPRQPQLVTIADLASGAYTNMLIKLDEVQFSGPDTLKTFANGYELVTENRTLVDCGGSSVLVRTSGYANFADVKVPSGKGSLIAIASQYSGEIQLYIRDIREVLLTGPRCPDLSTGEGTFADPYNVASGIVNQGTNDVWVQGYLVGVYETVDANGADLAEFTPSFTAPFNTATNVIIADTEDETNIANCVIVQLSSGDIRTKTNLKDNGSLLGEPIMYKGNLEAYFGAKGLKFTTGYWLNGNGINPDAGGTGLFTEKFTANLGSFTAVNVVGTQGWIWDSYGSGCAKMSGYAGSNIANEDWLISPKIDLSTNTGSVLTFKHAVNYLDTWDNLTVWASVNYTDGDPNQAVWSQLTGWDQTKPGSSWTFFDSGDVDLSAFDGKIINIAFKYVSTTTGGSTWEVGEVVVK